MKKAPIAVALVLVFGLFAAAFGLAPAIAQYTPPPTGTSSAGITSGNATSNATSTANMTSSNETSTSNATSTNATGVVGTNATGGETFSAKGSIATLIFDTGVTTTTSEAQNQTTTSNATGTAGANMTGGGNMTTGNTTASGNGTSGANATTLSQLITGGNASFSNMTSGGNITSNLTSTTGNNLTGTSNATSTSNGTANATSTAPLKQPYVASGDWSLDVKDGSVSDFKANFTMVHIDGTGRHTHELSNFQSSNSSTIDTTGNGTTFIFGTVDVAANGEPKWTGVDALIIIEKNNVVSVSLATEDTDGHFMGQPIYGIVDSMTDANGNEMLATGGNQTAGNATSGAMGGNETGGNQTGGFLGNLTQGIQNLTGSGNISGQ